MNDKTSPHLEFSDKYTADHAREYFNKHQEGFWRRVSNRREVAIARKALRRAGDPVSVLDLPCGTGRFWEMLCEHPQRRIYAADYSRNMFETGLQLRPAAVTRRVEAFQCSAFDIPLPENAVENVFCMRLVHHVGKPEDRLALFRELGRVASRSVILSLWVDGNYQAVRRRRLERRRTGKTYQNRFVVERARVESEFREAGMGIIGHIDFLKFHSIWRIYILDTAGN